MEDYIVPRNINVKEGVFANLNAKQVLYIIIGGAAGVGLWHVTAGIDTAVRIASSIFSVGGAVMFSIYKVEGQTLDRYVGNMIKYPLRQKTFGGDVNATAQKKEPTVRIRYALQ